MRNRTLRLSAVVTAALFVVRCSSSSPSNPSPTPTPTGPAVNTIVTGITSSDGAIASQQAGTPPAASGGPSVTATTGTTLVPGGSSIVTLTSASAFQSVYVSVPSAPGFAPASVGPQAVASGYYLLRLNAATTTAVIILNLSATLANGSAYQFAFAVATAGGAVGPSTTTNGTTAGSTGNVQVSLSWNTATDVDLHVVDPTGQEIYYGNTQSSNGGSLDLDSNAGCTIDNKQNENIRWGSSAPNGTYTVRVDLWSTCNVTGTTTYTVTVNNGGQRSTFNGTFAPGDADFGSRGSGRTVTTFNHTTGIAPSAIVSPMFVDPPFAPSTLKLRMARPPQ